MEGPLLVFLFGFSFGGSPDQPSDSWFGRDKAKHAAVSAAVQMGVHAALRANGSEYRAASWGAAAVTATVGVGKELWDRGHGGDPSWRDLAADAAGGGLGAVVMRQVRP